MMKFFKLTIAMFCLCHIAMISFAATGFEYWLDPDTLALWHFNEGQGNEVRDASNNNIVSIIEGSTKWDENEGWNAAGENGYSFVFDGQTLISISSEEKTVQPEDAITVEAWVYPEDLSGWKLICTHWGGAVVGSYHLGVEGGVPKFHINTGKGVAFAGAEQLKLQEWQHVAGAYDSKTIRLYINGQEVAATDHGGKLTSGDPDFDVVIGSKASREFHWNGLLDEVRISSVARKPVELSPNLDGPQAIAFNAKTLSALWGTVKSRY